MTLSPDTQVHPGHAGKNVLLEYSYSVMISNCCAVLEGLAVKLVA